MTSSTLDAYYRTELLYAQVQEVLQLDDHESGGNQHDAKGIKIAELLLTVAQVERVLGSNAEEEGRVLGVSPSQLRRTTGLSDDRIVQFHREAARHALLPLVEEKLREKCSDLCEVALPELQDRTRASGAVMEIPALILELQSLKTRKSTQNGLVKRQLHSQLQQDLARLKAMVRIVQRLLVEYKQQDAPRVLQTKMQWLAAYSRAMGVRARVLVKQIQVETYPREQAAILSDVHEALEERRRRALETREQLEAKLHLYRNADPEYQAIVRGYTHVLQAIDEKRKWIRSLNM